MGSRREDERNEATIRRLLKLPENKRCINCNSLGPQYVCTTFSTFVCTQCSGIHREFSHRIKSISMAKFTAAEVSTLQAGGNERARQIFFRGFDPARMSLPDSGSPEKLRDFIRRVYEKRLYVGDRPPSSQQEELVVEPVRRPEPKVEQRSSDLRSLSFDDHVGGKDSFNRRKSDFDRTSMGNRGSPKTVGSPQAPPRPTRHSYDDRDERIEQQQSPKPNGRERRVLSRPFSFRDFDVTPPPAQSITDILGDIPGLRVEVHKHNPSGDSADSSARSSVDSTRKALHSQSFGSVGDDRVTPTAADHKRADSSSLIDINGETGASRGVEDPFAETSQVASDSWATFNASPTPPAPPAGYPAPKGETNQWADSGWGQLPPPTSNLDTWSSFGTPSPPKGVPNQEHYNAIPLSGSQSTSSPGQIPRARRQLPPNFFAPSLEDYLPNLNVHQPHQMQPVFRPPQLDAPLEAYYNMGFPANSQTQLFQAQGQGQVQGQTPAQFQPQVPPQPSELSHQMSLSSQIPVQRSRNPFDDDFEDDSSASLASSAATGISMQFPSMDVLQAALPSTMPMGSGVPAVEAIPQTLPMSAASSDWPYSFTQFNDSTSSSGSFNFSPDQMASSFQTASFPVQPNVSGGFMSTHSFGQEAPYTGSQLHVQNVVRPAGGNPFG